MGYRLEGSSLIPAVQDFSLLHSVETDSGARPASYTMCVMGAFYPGVKRQGLVADHSPPSSVEVKKSVAMPPLPHMPSWPSA
jgi:hypothetical protein